MNKPKATQIFDLMEKFAGYGFNKSHAAAYALIAYQTAYFKAHHPAAFIAANLSLVMDDTDKVRHFHDEAKACGLSVLPPDVNASNYRFEDVIALVALFRPGPMELIPDYVACKQGKKRIDYLDPRLEPILAPTYGVMVYQEQVMKIAQVIGGYSLGTADLLRRAMGKKLPEEMAKHRFVFIDGAEKNGLSKGRATQLFDLMEKFAGYGFNKSHAAAYALIAYQTAYFKAHHPAAFIAANLSLVMDDTDKVRHFHDEANACGLSVLPPDVNASNYRFEPVDEKQIRYGLGGIKGT